MSRKAKRLKSRCTMLAQQVRSTLAVARELKEARAAASAEKEIEELRRQIRVLQDRLNDATDKGVMLKCFRATLDRLPEFAHMGRKITSLTVNMDYDMLSYALRSTRLGEPRDLYRHITYIIDDLAWKLKNHVIQEMTKEGAIF